MTLNILPDVTIVFLLLVARLGGMVMLMPGFGERGVPTRIRLALTLLLAFVFYPLLAPAYPDGLAAVPARLVTLLIKELIVGLAIGLLARMLVSVAQVAGSVIAYQLGLGFAQSVDPTMGQQGAIIGGFLGVTGTALIFILNLHHIAIVGMVDSYAMFPPGGLPAAADFAEAAVMIVTDVFRIAAQLSAPFIAFGLIFSLGLGVMSRLMPQLQVFFIALPASILIGLVLIALLLGALMGVYAEHVEDGLMRFVSR